MARRLVHLELSLTLATAAPARSSAPDAAAATSDDATGAATQLGVWDGSGPISIASDLLERHIQTLVGDPVQWRALIADDIVWELAYAPAIGHPARRAGRDQVTRHVDWFLGAVEDFRFIETKVHAFRSPGGRGAGQGPTHD